MPRTSFLPQPPHAQGTAVHPWADVLSSPRSCTRSASWRPPASCGRRSRTCAASPACLPAEPMACSRPTPWPRCARRARRRRPTAGTSSYGLGMQILRTPQRVLAGHTGSMPGFLCTLWVSVEDDAGAVVLANTTIGPADRRPGRRPGRHRCRSRAAHPGALATDGRARPDRCSSSPGPGTGDPPATRSSSRRTGTSRWARCPEPASQRAVPPRPAMAPGSGSTATSPARPCGRCATPTAGSPTWTSAHSSSPASPTTAGAPIPGGVDPAGWRPG